MRHAGKLGLVAAWLAVGACGGEANTDAGSGGAATHSGGAGGTTTSSSSSSSSTTSGGAGGVAGAGGASAGGMAGAGGVGGAAPFVLEVHTELDATPGLVLRVNLPYDAAACAALPFEAPCDDADGDGLSDLWEQAALERLRPIQRLDEQEPLVGDANAVLGDVGRVAPSGNRVHVFIMLGYSRDYGSCGFTAHNGDSERVALELEPLAGGGPGDVRVKQAYTAAHEGTISDHGRVFADAGLLELVHDTDPVFLEPRWVVYPSQSKHGTYATIAICEGISIIPCFDEDCAPDGVPNPQDFDRLPPVVNAGEEALPFVTDLTAIGFPGDDAWAAQDFCGGLGGGTCSAPVRDKLLASPF